MIIEGGTQSFGVHIILEYPTHYAEYSITNVGILRVKWEVLTQIWTIIIFKKNVLSSFNVIQVLP